jgi:hypothetical protein
MISGVALSQVGLHTSGQHQSGVPPRRLLLALMGVLLLLASLAYAHRQVLVHAPVDLASRRASLAYVGLPIAAVLMLAILSSSSMP